jgi:hypothetical protein
MVGLPDLVMMRKYGQMPAALADAGFTSVPTYNDLAKAGYVPEVRGGQIFWTPGKGPTPPRNTFFSGDNEFQTEWEAKAFRRKMTMKRGGGPAARAETWDSSGAFMDFRAAIG